MLMHSAAALKDVKKMQGQGFANTLTFAFMHHPYLVCILFGMPSLHLFTFSMFFISCIMYYHQCNVGTQGKMLMLICLLYIQPFTVILSVYTVYHSEVSSCIYKNSVSCLSLSLYRSHLCHGSQTSSSVCQWLNRSLFVVISFGEIANIVAIVIRNISSSVSQVHYTSWVLVFTSS